MARSRLLRAQDGRRARFLSAGISFQRFHSTRPVAAGKARIGVPGVAAVLTRAGWRAMPGARPCYAPEAPGSGQKRPSLAMQAPGYVTGQRSNVHLGGLLHCLHPLGPAVRLAQQAPRRVPQDLGVLQRRQWIDYAGAA